MHLLRQIKSTFFKSLIIFPLKNYRETDVKVEIVILGGLEVLTLVIPGQKRIVLYKFAWILKSTIDLLSILTILACNFVYNYHIHTINQSGHYSKLLLEPRLRLLFERDYDPFKKYF